MTALSLFGGLILLAIVLLASLALLALGLPGLAGSARRRGPWWFDVDVAIRVIAAAVVGT